MSNANNTITEKHFYDHLNGKRYLPELVACEDYTEIKGLFEIELTDINKNEDIHHQLNKKIFHTNDFILKDATMSIINFHGRVHSSSKTVFVYIVTKLENMNLINLSHNTAAALFIKLAI